MNMYQLFITNLLIKKVRHLKDISIPVSENQMKHIILTGKNGSGKTSVVEALAKYLDRVVVNRNRRQFSKEELLKKEINGLIVSFNIEDYNLRETPKHILAYYNADRIFKVEQPKHIEKIQFKDEYGLEETPRNEFVKYLVDLKMTEALARNNKKIEKADEIQAWFKNLEYLLKQIFSDETIQLIFDEDTFQFSIIQAGKEPFDFNTLSRGYQAVLDIVLDLIMQMQKQIQRSFVFHLPGIVLIDEIETHLHLELQRNIMPLLTTIFPNIQFIVTSHSPFILNSLDGVVIYDLEKHLLVENGLGNIPYDGIVDGYFGVDKLSDSLKEKFNRYKYLIKKKELSDNEVGEIAELEFYLDDIPDYLAINIATEYQKLKLEFINREDIDG